MRPRSNTLFHFTKNEDVLFNILKNGFWPKYCLEDIRWQNSIEFVAFPMVCFCDIPLARITDHVSFYGSYGIGLSRKWAEKNNLNPLLYISEGSNLCSAIQRIFSHSLESSSKDDMKPITDCRYLVAHSKPDVGQMIIDGNPVSKEFYQESEWRFVPSNEKVPNFMLEKEFFDEEAVEMNNNLSREHSSLRFLPSDICYIFVPKDSDIPNVINFIQQDLDQYPNADQKVLFSRVTSLESIVRDI